jgi:hypothetical protein
MAAFGHVHADAASEAWRLEEGFDLSALAAAGVFALSPEFLGVFG